MIFCVRDDWEAVLTANRSTPSIHVQYVTCTSYLWGFVEIQGLLVQLFADDLTRKPETIYVDSTDQQYAHNGVCNDNNMYIQRYAYSQDIIYNTTMYIEDMVYSKCKT